MKSMKIHDRIAAMAVLLEESKAGREGIIRSILGPSTQSKLQEGRKISTN